MSAITHGDVTPDEQAPTLELGGVSIYLVMGDGDEDGSEGTVPVIYIDTPDAPNDVAIRVRLNDSLIADGNPEYDSFTVGKDLER